MVKTSALALVPEVEDWSQIQALRLAYDKQVDKWPPHINLLYPFVPERDFTTAATELSNAVKGLGPLTLRFRRKGNFGGTAFLEVECDADPGLANLHAACRTALPVVPMPCETFVPHLTIGQFGSEDTAKAFLDSCPPLDIECGISYLSLLARDSMLHPFRTPVRVRWGGDGFAVVEEGGPQAYTCRPPRGRGSADAAAEPVAQAFYQVDEMHVRIVFDVNDDVLHSANQLLRRSLLFVIDQSGSMGNAYGQVKEAVRHMNGHVQGGDHSLSFVLYNDRARLATAQDVDEAGAGGMTNFVAAFDVVKKHVEGFAEGSSVTVVFMTDGQDTVSSPQILADAKVAFRSFLRSCGKEVVVHTIGFTSSHQRPFLEELRTMGSYEGVYRYAELGRTGTSLEQRFAEMFDFVDLCKKVKLRLGAAEFPADAAASGQGCVTFDVLLPKASLGADAPTGKDPCTVTMQGGEVTLAPKKSDGMFAIRCVDEMLIASPADLTAAQAVLSGVQLQKASKAEREELADAQRGAQARLDRYHQLFAAGARNGIAAVQGNVAAELSSLRHEAVFSKARRARSMAKRATSNASAVQVMDQLLRALPPVPEDEVAAIQALGLSCTLSAETPAEVLRDSHRDFFVFSLRVRRPEDVIDAPTTLDVQQFFSAVYSHEAFRSGIEHAVHCVGPEQAHGGFLGSTKHPVALGDDVGLFRGPDGQMMNACLPLYISDAHFARVRVQIKPVLGYFFTLDPLGYKGDQLIALFQVLGAMHCMRASVTQSGTSEPTVQFVGAWADWLLEDFTKLCKGLKPLALEYLLQGGYTGVARGDLLDEFVAGPAGRSKEQLPSLGVLIGWAAAADAKPDARFLMAFVEELWRRSFARLYKGQPHEQMLETLEGLLYGLAEADEGLSNSDGSGVHAKGSAAEDREFALWAKHLRGDLPKKQSEVLRKRFGSRGPEVQGLLALDKKAVARRPLEHGDAPVFFDGLVESELGKIRKGSAFTAALYGGRSFGEGFTAAERRLMLIQALQFASNSEMNEACAKGLYANTFDCLTGSQICEQLHEHFERHRLEKMTATVASRNTLLTARRIVSTSDLDAFVGRCAVSCPTRGGTVWNNVVGLLASCGGPGVGGAAAAAVPHLKEKVEAVLTGKLNDAPVIAEGKSWVHCPVETARRLQDAVGAGAFAGIELKMHGTWGHLYRESDIPNRHGHCNTKPNTSLVVSFSGFELACDVGGGINV